MKKTINVNDLCNEFKDYGRDYYSYEGYEALLNYYDEIDPDMELDVIAICGDCTEYGDYCENVYSFSSLIADYGYLINDDIEDDIPREDYIEELVEALEKRTTVLKLDNGNYIVFTF
jgi:hypothetical protein|nr:MAG TPA: hypothetical protein [Caudoviricetes sp.]